MRRVLSFTCEGATCAATLDEASGTTGLLIVSGGNEIRVGSHRGMAKLAAEIAAAGHPVFRFDRRGVGDSEGINAGFESSAPDITAALAAFRTVQPQLTRVIAFGNCDAATALLLHQVNGIDGLVLGNPWLAQATSGEPAPAATRAYYAQHLRDPRAWMKLLRGGVNVRQTAQSLSSAAATIETGPLATRFAEALAQTNLSCHILVAAHDGTGVAFLDRWHADTFKSARSSASLTKIETAAHSFASQSDHFALKQALLTALEK